MTAGPFPSQAVVSTTRRPEDAGKETGMPYAAAEENPLAHYWSTVAIQYGRALQDLRTELENAIIEVAAENLAPAAFVTWAKDLLHDIDVALDR